MANPKKNRVCPVERAAGLDNRIRRWLQNPAKILGSFIQEGMTVLDFGCGPGHFTVDLARMVGRSGRVFAVDLQEGMLEKLRHKIQRTDLEKRIILHKCDPKCIGISAAIDFALAFYVLHEIPDQKRFFQDLSGLLGTKGMVLVVEPPFHVSKSAFARSIATAGDAGFLALEGPRILFSKSVILQKG